MASKFSIAIGVLSAIVAVVASLVFWISYNLTHMWNYKTVSRSASKHWEARIQTRTYTSAAKPGSTSVLVRPLGSSEKKESTLIGVQDAPQIDLQWIDDETLVVSCATCTHDNVFLQDPPPPGLHVVYRMSNEYGPVPGSAAL